MPDSSPTSWVLVSRKTGTPLKETWRQDVADYFKRYRNPYVEVLTAHEWLARYNRLVREADYMSPEPEKFIEAVGT